MIARFPVLFFTALLMFAIPAAAADAPVAEDCAMSLDALNPVMQLDEKSAAAGHRVEKNEKERKLTETAILKNGMKITYVVGGCEHHTFTYTFENVPDATLEKYELIDLAIILLNDVPGFQESAQSGLTEMLKESKRNGVLPDDDGLLPCGDASCTIKREEKQVEVTYDFPL